MSFPHYEKYKDSGVEWLDVVPEGWTLGKFRHNFNESPEKIDDVVVGEMLSVSGYRGIEVKEYDDENRRRSDEDLVGYRIVRPGQLVVNTMWLNYAGLGVSDHEGHVSPAYRSYWITGNLYKRYVHHLMRSDLYVKGYTKFLTGIRPNSLQMSRDDLMEFPVLLPPLPEQHTIATFLDHETAKIDALVSEQEKLIQLLKEKRQAVISHAVTKGLDPNAKMKDSGVEWLGEVPEGWEVMPLGDLALMVKTGPFGSQLHSEDYIDDATPVINPANIREGRLIPDWSCTVTEDVVVRLLNYTLKVGDIIFGRRGEMGRCALVSSTEEGWLCGTGCLNVRLSKLADPKFISIFLRTASVREWLQLESVGSTMDNLNTQILSRIKVPLPPLTEQRTIASFLDRETTKIDTLTEEAQKAIELMKERRTALISATVTGKIDVRNWQPPADESAFPDEVRQAGMEVTP